MMPCRQCNVAAAGIFGHFDNGIPVKPIGSEGMKRLIIACPFRGIHEPRPFSLIRHRKQTEMNKQTEAKVFTSELPKRRLF